MEYIVPDYYNSFVCSADKCPDTCCAGWGIGIDEVSLNRYRQVEGEFGNRLFNSIDWKHKAFRQCDGRCAFLNKDNLCDIYTEIGHDMFCKTCRDYPKHIEEFPGVREISLAISCPEVAKLVIDSKEKVTYITKNNDSVDREEEGFDDLLFSQIIDARDAAIDILQNRNIDVRIRMVMALALTHDVQSRIDRNRIFGIGDVIGKLKKEAIVNSFMDKLSIYSDRTEDKYKLMKKMFNRLYKLERLKPEWKKYLDTTKAILYKKSEAEYNDKVWAFNSKRGYASKEQSNYECKLEQLLVYFTFIYYAGSIYDENVLNKMKFAIVSTLFVQELYIALGSKEHYNFTELARLYSREIEHSEKNLELMDAMMEENKNLFSVENLIICILN